MELNFSNTSDHYHILFSYDGEWVGVLTQKRGKPLKDPELVLSRDDMTNEEIGRIVRRSYTHHTPETP